MEEPPPLPQPTSQHWASRSLYAILSLAVLAGLASLMLVLGRWNIHTQDRDILLPAQWGLAGLIILLAAGRAAIDGFEDVLRQHWFDAFLFLAAGVGAYFLLNPHLQKESLHDWLTALSQAFLAGSIVVWICHLAWLFRWGRRHPIAMLFLGVIVLTGIGWCLLMLQAATNDLMAKKYYPTDAFFVAASCVTCTGLPLRNIGADYTPFGQWVILALIQIGGLLTMLLGSMLVLRVGKALVPPSPDRLQEPGKSDSGELARLAVRIVLAVFVIELIGAAALYPLFASVPPGDTSWADAAWYSIFHSVSAFCNAGHSLYGSNLMQGVSEGWNIELRMQWQVLGAMGPLMLLGGLGYPVLRELGRWMTFRQENGKRCGLSLQTQLTLSTTLLLIVFGAAGLLILEVPHKAGERAAGADQANVSGAAQRTENDWWELQAPGRVRESFFQSQAARSGGFHTVDLGTFSNAGKVWLCGLMSVGASPGSTGGGLKTVTFAILVLGGWAGLRRKLGVETHDRRLPSDALGKALASGVVYLTMLLAATLAMCMVMDPFESFIDIFFETCSALGNCGLTSGLTSRLTDDGKYVLAGTMMLGRMVPLATALWMFAKPASSARTWPEEPVALG